MHATTPVNVKQLKSELMNHPDKHFVDYLCNGLQYGFDTMVKYDNIKTMECRNNLSARSQKDTVADLINKELLNGFVYGPFEKLPFDDYRVSPLGVAEGKYSFKKRLILDLSAPHNDTNVSINDLIDLLVEHLLPSLDAQIADILTPLRKNVEIMSDKLTKSEAKCEELEWKNDDLEQYTRRQSIRIAEPGEIDRSHRVGPPRSNDSKQKPREIIVRPSDFPTAFQQHLPINNKPSKPDDNKTGKRPSSYAKAVKTNKQSSESPSVPIPSQTYQSTILEETSVKSSSASNEPTLESGDT
ncbi:unnamed protein product [Mytilus edulis]|uniref:Uncharacterized protein n=1 Tax=Mytilus edulis TaxID=6550 RepID=A0A8S3U7S6_MYTED|nr:unnamed protein product [Mytilus edulis]